MKKNLPAKALFTFLFIVAALLFGASASFAATITSKTTGGNWSTGATWVGNVAPGSGDDVVIAEGDFTITVNVNATCASLTFNANNQSGNKSMIVSVGANSLTVTGALTFSATSSNPNATSQLTLSTGTLNAGSVSFTDAKNKIVFSGAGTLNITSGNLGSGGALTTVSGSTVNFNGSAAQSAGGYTYAVLKSNNAAGVTLLGAATTTTLTIGDVTAGSKFNDGGFQLTSTGTLTLTSGTFKLGSGSAATAFPSFATRTIASGTTVEYASGVAQTIAGINYSNLTSSGSGARTLASSGTIGVAGTFTPGSNTYTTTGSTVNFSGTAAQSISGTASFNNLTISNSSASGVTLNGSASVAGTLTLTSGLLNIAAGNTLTLTSGGTVAGSSFGNAKHIATQVNTSTGAKGALQVNGISGSYTFPVGNGTYYLPATVTPSGSSNFSVTAFTGVTTNGEPNGNPTSRPTLVNAVWNVTRVSGSSTSTTLTLGWPAALERGSFVEDDARIGISHYSGGQWDDLQGSPDGNGRTATRSGLTSFSPFIVGYILADITLPVRFMDVKAAQVSTGTQIGWSNATEENVLNYVVERSTDGRSFTALSTVAANANNNEKASYEVVDGSALKSETYYRIKAVENSGKSTYSAVVKVSAGSGVMSLNVFPNPVTGNQISFTANNLPEGKYSLKIYTAAGQLLSARVLNHQGGFISQTLELNGAKAGQYVLEVNGAVHMYKHLMVQ